jgi:hypothetical protein
VEKWQLQLCHPYYKGKPGQEYQDQSAQGIQEKGPLGLKYSGQWSVISYQQGMTTD